MSVVVCFSKGSYGVLAEVSEFVSVRCGLKQAHGSGARVPTMGACFSNDTPLRFWSAERAHRPCDTFRAIDILNNFRRGDRSAKMNGPHQTDGRAFQDGNSRVNEGGA